MIYHVIAVQEWNEALEHGYHVASSLKTEGFIHCSLLPQVPAVIERYYRGREDLLLLHIDESLLIPELKYELAPSVNELFPHVYGPINLEAIIEVTTV